MSNELHPLFRQRLTEDQAAQVRAVLRALSKLRSALEYEERCVARWTLRVMNEGRGSAAESEALATVRRAGELRADAAAVVEDCTWLLDEALSGPDKERRPA